MFYLIYPVTVLKCKSLLIPLCQAIITINIGLYALFVHYGEKNYKYFNAKWMYRRGDINFSNGNIFCYQGNQAISFLSLVPSTIRKVLQKNRFPHAFQISQLQLQVGFL